MSHRYPAVFLLLLAAMLMTAAPCNADECENIVKMDGLFSKARQACPFSYYNFRFQQRSQMCGEKTGESKWKQLFSQGASAFDSKASGMGKAALCEKLTKDFPMTVKF
jgi:hypothetical protein